MSDSSSSSVASVAIVIIVIVAAFAFYFLFLRSGGEKKTIDIDVKVPKVNYVIPAQDYSPMQGYSVISG